MTRTWNNDLGTEGPFKYNFKWQEGTSVDWCFGDWDGNCLWDEPSRPEARRPMPRHGGRVNVSFLDGHVKSLLPDFMNAKVFSNEDIMRNHD